MVFNTTVCGRARAMCLVPVYVKFVVCTICAKRDSFVYGSACLCMVINACVYRCRLGSNEGEKKSVGGRGAVARGCNYRLCLNGGGLVSLLSWWGVRAGGEQQGRFPASQTPQAGYTGWVRVPALPHHPDHNPLAPIPANLPLMGSSYLQISQLRCHCGASLAAVAITSPCSLTLSVASSHAPGFLCASGRACAFVCLCMCE